MFRIVGERIAQADTTAGSAADGDTDGARDGAGKILLDGDIVTHEWSGMNTYLQYSDGAGLGMGGGGAAGTFGLFVGEDFLNGSTGT